MKFNSKYLGVVGIIVFAYILFNIDISKVITIINEVDILFLIMAILINPVVIVLLTLRWRYIVRTMGVDLKFKRGLILRLKGVFLGNITPGRIGDFYRAKHLSEETALELAKSFSSVIIDRILDIGALIFLNIIGLFILFYLFDIKIVWVEYIIISLVILLGLFLIINKNLMKKLLRPIFKLFVPMDARRNVVMHFNQFYSGLSKIKYANYLSGFLISVMLWIITCIGIYLLAMALSIEVSLIFIIAMAPVGAFLSALPISVSGLGTREAVYVFFLSSINIESEYAVALALLVFLFLNIIYIPIGIVAYTIFGDKK